MNFYDWIKSEKDIYDKLNDLGYMESAITEERGLRDFFNKRINCILKVEIPSGKTYEKLFYENEILEEGNIDILIKKLEGVIDKNKRAIEKLRDKVKKYDINIESLNEQKKVAIQDEKEKCLKRMENYETNLDILDDNMQFLLECKERGLDSTYFCGQLIGKSEFEEEDKAFFRQIIKMFPLEDDLNNLKKNRWEKFEYKDRKDLFDIIKKLNRRKYDYNNIKNQLSEKEYDFSLKNIYGFGEWNNELWEGRYSTEIETLEEMLLFPNLCRISIKLRILHEKIYIRQYIKDKRMEKADIKFEAAFDKYMNIISDETYIARMKYKIEELKKMLEKLDRKENNNSSKKKNTRQYVMDGGMEKVDIKFEAAIDKYMDSIIDEGYIARIKYKIEQFEKMLELYDEKVAGKRMEEENLKFEAALDNYMNNISCENYIERIEHKIEKFEKMLDVYDEIFEIVKDEDAGCKEEIKDIDAKTVKYIRSKEKTAKYQLLREKIQEKYRDETMIFEKKLDKYLKEYSDKRLEKVDVFSWGETILDMYENRLDSEIENRKNENGNT